MSEKKWSASNYRANKAKRLAQAKPEWVENPETGQSFFLRRVGAMAAMVANYMTTIPHAIADGVVQNWKERGVDINTSPTSQPVITPQKIAEGERDLKMMARIVAEACVIPRLVPGATGEIDGEIDPAELDDSDVLFIFRYATGQVGQAGGGVISMADVKSGPKRPSRMSRSRNDGAKLRDASEQISQAG